ncbi:HAD family hydrolase [Alkalihalophilus pseudofirmus]|uniref:HAD family hydrolase n=1 Tax=Alkalihalophilus pseudofirmus TaxID=79885 RepID=UPI00259B6324|nr:HAD family hydrolase [Alkalihalophilus pseudofirmus]WEG15264.1 HAD family hydrolase [Alkalihalophilus pseudofirmus]
MNPYKVVLFDLDGTLSDPKAGITKSVQYALEKMNKAVPDEEELEPFIGPPLHVSFSEYCGFDEWHTQTAINYYRERFKRAGMYENELYEGIPHLLHTLNNQRFKLVVATSKPTVFAEKILTYFAIDHYFELIVGSQLDGSRSSKAEIIQFILDCFPDCELDEFVMIGDREHDLIGANQIGIDSIAVTYGYGSFEELKACHPTYLVESVEEVKEILMGRLNKQERKGDMLDESCPF